MERETVKLAEAAVMLGMSQQGVRELMKRKIIDIGVVYPSLHSGKTNRYLISREKLERLLKDGLEIKKDSPLQRTKAAFEESLRQKD